MYGVVINQQNGNDTVILNQIPDNFVVVLTSKLKSSIAQTIDDLKAELIIPVERFAKQYLSEIDISDINYLLYSCDREESDIWGGSTYTIPGHGKLPFAGFAGIYSILTQCSTKKNQDHPLYVHLQQDDHLLEYYEARIKKLGQNRHFKFNIFFQNRVAEIKKLPRILVPVFVHRLLVLIISSIQLKFLLEINLPIIFEANYFSKNLLQSLAQFVTPAERKYNNNLDLNQRQYLFSSLTMKSQKNIDSYNFIPNVSKQTSDDFRVTSKFKKIINSKKLELMMSFEWNRCRDQEKQCKLDHQLYLVSAGLPYFSTGVWKNWGRDTFISFRSLFLITGLSSYGRSLILHYASYLRHSLIPNMLQPSRYNSRDATWWFVKAVRDYIEDTSDYSILKENINMIYLNDDKNAHEKMSDQRVEVSKSLVDILQQIFQSHAEGISFVEWNSPQIDNDMTSNGFHVWLKIDWKTGFIFGGNKSNCLTWMDKMGSSNQAGNKGIPASSRYGAPIELTSLLYLGLEFMTFLYEEEYSPFKGVRIDNQVIEYERWAALINHNFESHYYIPKDHENLEKTFKFDPIFVSRRGIYKDTINDTRKGYMLRPNALIAFAVSPKLFKTNRVSNYIKKVEKYLMEENSIGIKTLDPLDESYRCYYDNDEDSHEFQTAKGFSYHNGPEWVWLYGYYMMSKIELKKRTSGKIQINENFLYIHNHYKYIQTSEWLSLPEMTNADGKFCKNSCPSQLWSVATIIEALNKHQQKNSYFQQKKLLLIFNQIEINSFFLIFSFHGTGPAIQYFFDVLLLFFLLIFYSQLFFQQ